MKERMRVQKFDGFVESEAEWEFLLWLVGAYQMDVESWDGGEAQVGRGGADVVSMLGGAGAKLASAAEKWR